VEACFDDRRMAADYNALYLRLLGQASPAAAPVRGAVGSG
jgi:hypothetical protein